MKTVEEVELQLGDAFTESLQKLNVLPTDYKCSVRLHARARAKRRTAPFEKHWTPDTDSIYISFDRIPQATEMQPTPVAIAAPLPSVHIPETGSNTTADLIRALDRAESRTGYEFVALKWFRDTALPAEKFSWAAQDSARRAVLRDAIESRLILTGKVPNPKSPEFPVTTIRLNRHMPQVRAVLGDPAEAITEFQPIPIRGESLSDTVLRDRR